MVLNEDTLVIADQDRALAIAGVMGGEATGVTGKDVAKRLLDHGYMAPTLYFPQIVPECLMIEPTETESKEVLDDFAAAFLTVLGEDPDIVKSAPHTTPVGRVDEVWAARNLVLRYHSD